MAVKCVRDRTGPLVVLANYGSSQTLTPVAIGNSKSENVQFNHDQCLYEVSINRITKPCAACLDFKTAAPFVVKCINFILQRRSAILTEEDRSLNFVSLRFPLLDDKPQRDQICS